MSPENDQTRWIGIRPVNPPEDIPVTLDGEVPHVIVDSGGGGDLSPGSLKYNYEARIGMVLGTWYTTLEVAAGSGYLRYISINSGTTDLDTLHLKVTIDGTAGDDIDLDTFRYGSLCDPVVTTGKNVIIPLASVRFSTSLKIEIKSDFANDAYRCNVLYTLDL